MLLQDLGFDAGFFQAWESRLEEFLEASSKSWQAAQCRSTYARQEGCSRQTKIDEVEN